VLGAGYLLFLGLQALWSARHGRASDEHTTSGHASLSAKTAFRQGLLSNLSNPKMAAFFGSLLPQFSPADGSTFWTLLALGLMFCLLTLAWLSIYASAIGRLGVVMRRPRVRQVLDAVTGTALVVLGVRLATQRQPG
jgi:threonine/homoserine/homoserine lactone efflux protein